MKVESRRFFHIKNIIEVNFFDKSSEKLEIKVKDEKKYNHSTFFVFIHHAFLYAKACFHILTDVSTYNCMLELCAYQFTWYVFCIMNNRCNAMS
jgi:hypothetical protein